MRYARPILLSAAILSGIIAGLAKILEPPQTVAFFAAAGVPAAVLSLLGAAQIGSALLMLLRRTRMAAACILAATFSWSAWLGWQAGHQTIAAFAAAAATVTLVAAFWRRLRP